MAKKQKETIQEKQGNKNIAPIEQRNTGRRQQANLSLKQYYTGPASQTQPARPGRSEQPVNTGVRSIAFPLVSISGISAIHAVEVIRHDHEICMHVISELTAVIAKVDTTIYNIDIADDIHPAVILRMLLEKYKDITKADNIDINVKDGLGFNLAGNPYGYNPDAHFFFDAWNYCDKMVHDLYPVYLEDFLPKFNKRPTARRVAELLLTLLHGYEFMRFGEVTSWCQGYLEQRIDEGLALDQEEDEESAAELENQWREELASYQSGGKAYEKIYSLFSNKAVAAATPRKLIMALAKFKPNKKNEKNLVKAATLALELIKSKESLDNYNFSKEVGGGEDEEMPLKECFSILYSGTDAMSDEIGEFYDNHFNNYGHAHMMYGVRNCIDKPFKHLKITDWPDKFLNMCNIICTI